ncbi:MAG: DUF2281 domain-containing protein [Flavobacteriales bacterium]
MSAHFQFTQLSSLPADVREQVMEFIAFLMERRKRLPEEPKERKLGLAKGLIEIPPDFDEPLEDLKPYME